MAEIPTTLSAWTYDAIASLAVAGQGESDRHDFKGGLEDSDRTSRHCCAFANARGGFLIYGVAQRALGRGWDVAGTDRDEDFGKKFADKVRVEPTITYSAPQLIPVPNSRSVIYLVEVPRGDLRPYVPLASSPRAFWRRSVGGDEPMSLEEIRAEFGRYEERREKLKALFLELLHDRDGLMEIGHHEGTYGQGSYLIIRLDTAVLDRLLVDSYSEIFSIPELARTLFDLRRGLRTINSIAEQSLARQSNPNVAYKAGGEFVEFTRDKVDPAIKLIDRATGLLEKSFGLKNPFST